MLLRYLYFNETIEEALRAPRIHHQLIPMQIDYEQQFDKAIVDALEKVGHVMHGTPYDGGFTSMTAIGREKNRFVPVYDPRRIGSFEVY